MAKLGLTEYTDHCKGTENREPGPIARLVRVCIPYLTLSLDSGVQLGR